MKTERHPNIEEIINVLKHLNIIWQRQPTATIKYLLAVYENEKKEQLEGIMR